MTVQEIIQDWYENEVIDSSSEDFMFCPYCGDRLYRTRFYKHVKTIHGRTFEEMIEECCLHGPLPTCPYPNCNNILVLKQPTKMGSGLQKYCCSQHGSSLTMKRMRNDPTLRAKHAREASDRLKENNPSCLEHNRKKASFRMSKRWESTEYREKVIRGARKNIMKLLLDDDFLDKKSMAASKRMREMNKNIEFVDRSAKGRIFSNKADEAVLYVLVYRTFLKVGVTSLLANRLRALKGYEDILTYILPLSKAADVEYALKRKFEKYKGPVPEPIGKTEVFSIDDKDEIVYFIKENIK